MESKVLLMNPETCPAVEVRFLENMNMNIVHSICHWKILILFPEAENLVLSKIYIRTLPDEKKITPLFSSPIILSVRHKVKR